MDPETRSILHERARRLAQVPPEPDTGAMTQTLRFRLGEEEYAIELHRLAGIQPVEGLTPVPCAPPQVAGVLNVHGEIISVLSFSALLGLTSPGVTSADRQVVLVDHGHGRLGLLVDEVAGVYDLDSSRLDPAPSGSPFACGVAEARITCLDLDRILSDHLFESARG